MIDLLIRIKNASMVSKKELVVDFRNSYILLLSVLVNNGLIFGFKEQTNSMGHKEIVVLLKSNSNNTKVIQQVKIISKPGKRVYAGYREIMQMRRKYFGVALFIISTNKGIISDVEAIDNKVGGEVICVML